MFVKRTLSVGILLATKVRNGNGGLVLILLEVMEIEYPKLDVYVLTTKNLISTSCTFCITVPAILCMSMILYANFIYVRKDKCVVSLLERHSFSHSSYLFL